MPENREQYERIRWSNENTKLSADNLNHMEDGIVEAQNLALSCATDIDEIYAAFIDQLNFEYDYNTNKLILTIGSTEGENPTNRFNLVKQVEIIPNVIRVGRVTLNEEQIIKLLALID